MTCYKNEVACKRHTIPFSLDKGTKISLPINKVKKISSEAQNLGYN